MKKIALLLGAIFAMCLSINAQAPANCPDIMLQGFHWDSYGAGEMDKTYGRTKWADLTSQATEIAETFTMVWLPPSAKSSGGTGYHPKEWSNQNSDWGNANQLKTLINTLHEKNCKVIADIVINHRDGNYNWTDFCNENFGTYGNFQDFYGKSAQLICRDDDAAKNGYSCTGANDAGYDYVCEASGGYCASRDLDHSNTYLQGVIKAYLKWMKNEMGYDGWRYDLVKGYLGKYTKMYNEAAGAYYSVGEYWDGNYDAVKNWINATGKTSTAFDFPNKYSTFNDGLAKSNYGAMVNGYKVPNGLCGADEMKRYATTFIDNHDTFRDGSKYQGDWTKANAVLLAQPGIPCVFYPHWEKCKADIKKMAATRKAMGIHSQSACTTAGGGSYYQSTTTGTKGTLICFVGSGWSDPAGYTKACSGNGWAYYTSSQVVVPDTGGGNEGGNTGGTTSSSYAIRVNGTTDYTATYMGKSANSDHEEYMVSVQLNAGDTFVTYDLVNKAGWVMTIEPYGEYANFTAGTSSVTCTKAGCYDFYIKMMFQNDSMYIGPGTGCTGGGTDVGGGDDSGNTGGNTGGDDSGNTGGGNDSGNTGGTTTSYNYAIRVNGTTDYGATYMGKSEHSDHEEYMVSVQLNAGDTFVTYDLVNNAGWVMAIEPYGEYANFTAGTTSVTCNVAGCYDFYIKMMYQNDSMYIGPGTNCSGGGTDVGGNTGGNEGGNTGGNEGGNDSGNTGGGLSTDYYLIGYIDGADYGSGETDWENLGDYKFVNGKVTATFKETSYVYVKTGDLSKWFMAEEYVMPSASGASGVLYATSANPAALEKIGIPAGTVTFTLKENADGTITLSYTMQGTTTDIEDATATSVAIYPNPTTGKATILANQEVENVVVRNLIGKTVASFNSNQIDLSNLAASMYLVEIQLENGESTVQKLIKK